MIQKTLLVIDDDEDFTTLVRFIFEYNTNWNILTASNGTEGVTKALLQLPNVILLDVVMPKLSGLDVYNLLKSNPKTYSIPIVFVTAMVTIETIIKLKTLGDVEVITKPFDIMTLENQVSDVCNRYLVTHN